jgi:hypothetical protein
MTHDTTETRFSLIMKNRPGELVKLTRFLSEAGVNVSTLRIASLGDNASIEFSTTKKCALPARFLKARSR